MIEQTKTRQENQKLSLIDEEIDRQRRRTEYLRSLREAEKANEVGSDRAGPRKRQKIDTILENDFAVDDYDSDEDNVRTQVRKVLAGLVPPIGKDYRSLMMPPRRNNEEDNAKGAVFGVNGDVEEPDEIKVMSEPSELGTGNQTYAAGRFFTAVAPIRNYLKS